MFKVGDKVVITNGRPYIITKEGSAGVVVYTDEYYADVEFYHLNKNNQEFIGETYSVDIKDLALIDPKTNTEIVIDKIREMNNRFNTRKQHESVLF